MIFPCLAFLALGSSSGNVLNWLVNLVTSGAVIDFVAISITYIFFYRACKAQGIDRNTFPYCGWFQPYSGYISAIFMTLVVFFYGYTAISPWDVGTFFSYYAMSFVAILTFTFWKIFKRTKFVPALECDLIWERPQIDAYEEALEDQEGKRFWVEVLDMFGFTKLRNTIQQRKIKH
jgi:amino acid transporter